MRQLLTVFPAAEQTMFRRYAYREIDQLTPMVSEIAQIIAAVEVSNALLERRLADALAINVACDLPPPFGLLQVVETLGLGPLHPESTSPPLAMVEVLLHAGREYAPSLRESFICLSPPGPVTHTPICAFSCPRVGSSLPPIPGKAD
jgi:hypothetical protein